MVLFSISFCIVASAFQSVSAFAFWEPDGTLTVNSVSMNAGAQRDGNSFAPSISSDGRYITFESTATNLVAGDTNNKSDVFVKDTQTSTITRISTDDSGAQGTGDSFAPSISSDGRYITFTSSATNLVLGDTNNSTDVFVKDTITHKIVAISATVVLGDDDSFAPSISSDGRYITFESKAINLVAGDTNNSSDVFVRDTTNSTITRVSTSSTKTQADSDSFAPSISSDGRYITFHSIATNLVAGDTNNKLDVFKKQVGGDGDITRVTVANGNQGDGSSFESSVSSDGRYITFTSSATNLVAGDTNNKSDVFVKDTQTSTITRISTDDSGAQGNDSSFESSISSDGRYITFTSSATNLVAGDTNKQSDVFVKDTQTNVINLVSTDSNGTEGDDTSFAPSVSSDGRYITFHSFATNLVAGDTNNFSDVFVTNWSKNASAEISRSPVEATTPTTPVSAPPVLSGFHVTSIVFDSRRIHVKGRVVCQPVTKQSICTGSLTLGVQTKKSGSKKQKIVSFLKNTKVRGSDSQAVSFSIKKNRDTAKVLRKYANQRVPVRITTQNSASGYRPVIKKQTIKIVRSKN